MANPHQQTKPTRHETDATVKTEQHAAHEEADAKRTAGRGHDEGIGTESNPHGAVTPDPRKNLGQNAGLGTESKPSGAAPLRSDAPQKPVSSGPTVARVDAPILEGHEGQKGQKGPDGKESAQAYETVRLTDGPIGPEDGVAYRVATPLPLVLVSGGRRFVRSTKDVYVLQHP